ncbi:hypothetical protein, partial [Haliscomenobacter sp.]|uniref:hypothetical protein n=1 Tax=Haliscomenobacter sp. TaxID=2717303 RepID=UPI0033652983
MAEQKQLKKMLVKMTTGIVKILSHTVDAFVQRYCVAFVAHHFAFMLLNFEFARFAVWRGELKILVSVVRFRPRPPSFKVNFSQLALSFLDFPNA